MKSTNSAHFKINRDLGKKASMTLIKNVNSVSISTYSRNNEIIDEAEAVES
jgi:hypothetical protein